MNKKTFYIFSSILLIINIVALIFSSITTANEPQHSWVVLISILIFIFMIVLTCFLYFSNVEFICAKCSKQFKPKTFTSLTAAHMATLRHLKCPHCKETSWCKETWNIKN